MPRKAAYFLSIRDSRRPELRGDELCAFTWERLRNDANVDLDYMERADPSEVLGDVCHFRLSKRRSDRGLMSSLPGQLGFGIGSGGDMKWLISKFLDRRSGQFVTYVLVAQPPPFRRSTNRLTTCAGASPTARWRSGPAAAPKTAPTPTTTTATTTPPNPSGAPQTGAGNAATTSRPTR